MDLLEGDAISQNVVTLVNICTQERDCLGGVLCFRIAINDEEWVCCSAIPFLFVKSAESIV